MKWLERVEEGLVAFLLAAMTLVTCAQVVARYGFDYSFSWALELTTMLFAWLIFLGIPYGVRVGSHIGVDALVKMMGPVGGRITAAAAALLCIVYSVLLFIGSWEQPAKVPRSILAVSFALLAWRFAEVLYRIATGRNHRLDLSDEAAEALRLQAELGEDERRRGKDRE